MYTSNQIIQRLHHKEQRRNAVAGNDITDTQRHSVSTSVKVIREELVIQDRAISQTYRRDTTTYANITYGISGNIRNATKQLITIKEVKFLHSKVNNSTVITGEKTQSIQPL